MTLERMAQAVEGKLVYPDGYKNAESEAQKQCDSSCKPEDTITAEAVVLDSRKVCPGAVFVATRGERVDGHDYIDQVFEKGALGVICEKAPEVVKGACIVVDDSFAALKKLAKYYREQMDNVKIVGIVGSVGKTSTKELVASVLEQHFCTLKTEGNLNNEIGVPLTILRLRDEHEAAVVEMGINHFGEMDRLGDIVKPDAVVFTNVGPCHLEFLQDLGGVLRAKSEVFKHIRKGGTIFLNAEDEKLNTVRSVEGHGIVRFGKGGDVFAENVENLGLEGSEADIVFPADRAGYKPEQCSLDTKVKADGLDGLEENGRQYFHAKVHLPGAHMVLNSLAATAVGLTFGMTTGEICVGIEAAKPVSGRSNLINTGRYLVVDDCYNANPKADCAAIDMMSGAKGRKVAILGDMFELGENTPALHAEVGTYAAGHGIDVLVCVGELSKNMYDAAVKAGGCVKVLYFGTLEELLSEIETIGIENGDTILVKASHGMKFTGLVEALTK